MDALTASVNRGPHPALPAESPLDMPVRSLRQYPKSPETALLPSEPRGVAFRRLMVIGGAVLMTAAAANEMYKVLTAGMPLTCCCAKRIAADKNERESASNQAGIILCSTISLRGRSGRWSMPA